MGFNSGFKGLMYWEFISFIFCYLTYISSFVRSYTAVFFGPKENIFRNIWFFVFFMCQLLTNEPRDLEVNGGLSRNQIFIQSSMLIPGMSIKFYLAVSHQFIYVVLLGMFIRFSQHFWFFYYVEPTIAYSRTLGWSTFRRNVNEFLSCSQKLFVAFAKLKKRMRASLCLFVCLSARKKPVPKGKIFIKIWYWRLFFENLLRKFKLDKNLRRMTATLHELVCNQSVPDGH